jgi:4'-phosphopantetheinyl transferase
MSIAHAPIRELGGAELALLPASERERSFSSGERRRQFQCGRWLLRSLLRARGDASAAEQDIIVGEHGKPYFEGGAAFSIAHAGNRVTCCVADEGPVGIDLEFANARKNIGGIAKRFFSADEADWLSTQSTDRFFMLWVLKEAWVKAQGLSIFGHMEEPGFRVNPPAIAMTGGEDVDQQVLFSLDGAFLAVAASGTLQAELVVECWDPVTESFVADKKATEVART